MLQIGSIKSFARKGELVTVYFEDGKSDRFIAGSDLTSKNVVVMGNQALSQDPSQLKLYRTTKLFKNYGKQESGGYYPYFTVFIQEDKLIGIYNNSKKIIGEVDFTQLEKVNLNYFGKTFKGTALSILSGNVRQAIAFDQKEITATYDFDDPTYFYFLSGNVFTRNLRLRPREDYYQEFRILNAEPVSADIVPPITNVLAQWNDNPHGLGNDIYGNSNYPVLSGFVNPVAHPYFFLNLPPGTNESTDNSYSIGNAGAGDGVITHHYTSLRQTHPAFTWTQDIRGHYLLSQDPPRSNPFIPDIVPTDAPETYDISHDYNDKKTKNWNYDFEEDISLPGEPERKYVVNISGQGSTETYYRRNGTWSYIPVFTPGAGNIGYGQFFTSVHYETWVDVTVDIEIAGVDAIGRIQNSSSTEEILEPIIINDYLTKTANKKRTRSYSLLAESKANLEYGNYLDTIATTPFLSHTTHDATEVITRESYEVVFNKGDIGLYTYQKVDSSANTSKSGDFLDDVNPLTQGTGSLTVSNTFTNYYCAIRDDDPVKINSGFANNYSRFQSDQLQKIINFSTGNQADKFVNLQSFNFTRKLDYVTSRSQSFHSVTQPNVETSYVRPAIPPDVLESFDPTGELAAVLASAENNYYLCYCRATALNMSYFLSNNLNSMSSVERNVDSIDLELLEVKKIKPFLIPHPLFGSKALIFTLKGCEVFKFLDPNRISFFEKEPASVGLPSRKILTANLLPISASNTQSLVFEIIDNDIVFLGISGGDVTDSGIDPAAANWTQYYPDKLPTKLF